MKSGCDGVVPSFRLDFLGGDMRKLHGLKWTRSSRRACGFLEGEG